MNNDITKSLPLSDEYARWLAHVDAAAYSIPLIQKACVFASQYVSINASFSLSTVKQGLAMADALVSLQCDYAAICAAILYPIIYNNPELLEKVSQQFDKSIWKILKGALQTTIILNHSTDHQHVQDKLTHVDNLRKMFLAMADDIRTVLLKLAEQLVILQNLHHANSDLQKRIAQDTLHYYAPLANRLGIGFLKWQLEDWAFRYLNPEEFRSISTAYQMKHEDRVQMLHKMIAELKNMLANHRIHPVKISGRIKHIYSIYKKIQRKKVGVMDIYDRNAIRIIAPTVTDCYAVLSIVHDKWHPITAEFDDYVAKPKPNGYRSIHTAVNYIDNIPVEIQIRTFDMHEQSELGIAAHWKYKENQPVHDHDSQKITLLRELLDWQKTIGPEEKNQKLYQEAFQDRIYVFSPAGDVFDLPKGATPLDFAYRIHTNVGHRCRGAKINAALMPLTHALQTGDRVEILTTKENHPSRDWMRADLGYLTTSQAIRKVKHWFYQQDYDRNFAAGSLLWEKMTRQHHLQKGDLEKAYPLFNLKSTNALLVALGSGDMVPSAILNRLHESNKTDDDTQTDKLSPPVFKPQTADFSIQGTTHLLTQLARCCHPIPGDDIIGYITKGRGISVHQQKCRNILFGLQNKPERFTPISWSHDNLKNFRVTLLIESDNRSGLLNDITGIIAKMNISIIALQSRILKNNTALSELTLTVSNVDMLKNIQQKIMQINGVVNISRK